MGTKLLEMKLVITMITTIMTLLNLPFLRLPLLLLFLDIYAVASTEAAAKLITKLSNYFTPLRFGTVTGIPAILLNEGALMNLDVIVFVVNVLRDVPDFRAAAIVSEAISRIIPNLSCDIDGLIVEAQMIENRMKNVRAEQKRISYIA